MDPPLLVVGLGASAGGSEALLGFFAALTEVSDVAFVVVHHPEASAKSSLADALRRATTLEIVEVKDGCRLVPGRVFVAPERGVTQVLSGHLRISLSSPDDPRTSIDACLSSIAQAYGPSSVGILLSGSGSDGALGLAAIASVGGLTMAQDDASALFDAMPNNAVSTGVVDRVLAPAQLADEVVAHGAHLRRHPQPSAKAHVQSRVEEVLPQICTAVEHSTGHGLHQYKVSTLHRRIQRRMQVLRIADAETYLGMLREDPNEAGMLLREVLIGVTAFFRDAEAFDVLAVNVIPSLLRERSRDEDLRIWVPGCASGEEAYSLAILFREALAGSDGPSVQIFASDIDERALAIARAGSYPAGISECVSRDRLERWFARRGSRWQVVPELREMCLFAAHNLVSDPPFSRLDLISCRNVLIYLGAPLQQKLVSIFHYALKPNGYLFLGPSENIVAHTELFRPVSPKHRISQRKATSLRMPGLLQRSEGGRTSGPIEPGEAAERPDIHLVAHRLVLDEFMPSYVVVDEHGQILSLSARIERYLEFGEGAFRNSVIAMMKPGLRSTVRPALTEAIRTRRRVLRRHLPSTDGEARLGVTVQPIPRVGESDDLFVIVFEEGAQSERDANRDAGAAPASVAALEQLERELAITREDLERSIQDLESANEELKSSNEELLSMNEELQSANEELETSKEEVQQGNEALVRTNTDLENLLSSSDIATIFLDEALQVQRYTPSTSSIYNLLPVDIGRSIAHITHLAQQMPPLPGPNEVAVSGVVQHELATVDGRTFLRRVLPYKTSEGEQQGIVATFTDVTELRHTEQLVRRHAAQLEAIYARAPVGLAVIDAELRYVSVNRFLARLAGDAATDPSGRSIDDGDGPLCAEAIRLVRRTLETRESVTDVELRGVRGEGMTPFVWQASFVPIEDDSGRVVLVSAVIHDVTERVQHIELLQDRERRLVALAEELAEAKQAAESASRAKSDFLANMSHEIRTPMTAILGSADVLATRLTDDDDLACVDVMKRNGRHLVEVIDDILDLSRIEAGKLVPDLVRFDPIDVLDEIDALMRARAEERGLELLVNAEPPMPATIRGDPTRLRQILVNLIGNAIKFTSAGRVVVTVQCDPVREQLDFSVMDTGVGIERALQERLFEPFVQADMSSKRGQGGTGLGLTISKRLVEALGGRIELTSKPGEGSTFSFTIPTDSLADVALVAERQRKAVREATPLPKADLTGARILLVDDHPDVRQVVQRYLEDAGATITCADDGRAALDKHARAKTDGTEPDIVVLDMQMPMLDGYEAARQLRELGFRGRIVALTAAAMKGDREKCIDAGCDDYLTKPVDRALLVACIAFHWEGVRARRGAPADPRIDDSRVRVLVVDDHADSADALAMLLEHVGYDVRTAMTGADALRIAQQFVPNAAILDLGLPDMSGYDVLRGLQDLPQLESCTFVALSGRGSVEEREHSRAAGFHHHLVKPVGLQRLKDVLPVSGTEPPAD